MTLSDSAKFVDVVFIRPLHSRRSQHKGTRRGGLKQAGVVFIIIYSFFILWFFYEMLLFFLPRFSVWTNPEKHSHQNCHRSTRKKFHSLTPQPTSRSCWLWMIPYHLTSFNFNFKTILYFLFVQVAISKGRLLFVINNATSPPRESSSKSSYLRSLLYLVFPLRQFMMCFNIIWHLLDVFFFIVIFGS